MKIQRVALLAALVPMALLCACQAEPDKQRQGPILESFTAANPVALSFEECLALDAEYVKALEEALVCNPLARPKQCILLTGDKLTCGCAVYINPTNGEALAKLREMRNAWRTGGCSTYVFDCPAMPCRSPITEECAALSSADRVEQNPGTCVTVF